VTPMLSLANRIPRKKGADAISLKQGAAKDEVGPRNIASNTGMLE
jgi:hypothetical protein